MSRPQYVECDLCGDEAAYTKKVIAPTGQSAEELYKACRCEPLHRHCLYTTLTQRMAEQGLDWDKCTKCGQQYKLDDHTRTFIEGAASAVPEIRRLEGRSKDNFIAFYEQAEKVGELDGKLAAMQLKLTLWQVAAAALAATSLGLLARSKGGSAGWAWAGWGQRI